MYICIYIFVYIYIYMNLISVRISYPVGACISKWPLYGQVLHGVSSGVVV